MSAPDSQHQSVFDKHPRLTVLVLMGLSFVVLDFLVTLGAQVVRGIVNPPEASTAEVDPNQGYRRRSDIYHHDLQKNAASDVATWGTRQYSVYTDSLGFKSDRVKTTPLTSDRYRILFIGDSFTEGIGYEYPETFVGRVAGGLEADGIEVLNAGVSSYSPIIYWRKIKYLIEEAGLEFDEVVVFLDVSDIQDEAKIWRLADDGTVADIAPDQAIHEAAEPTGVKGLLKRRFMFTYFVLNSVHDLIFPASDYYVDQERSLWTVDEGLLEAWGRDGLERAAGNMDKLRALLDSRGIPLTLAVYPWPDQIVRNDRDSIQVSYWQEWAGDNGVAFLNYFPCFVTGGDIRDVLDVYYILRDSHWNAEGHRLVADEFLRYYEQRDLSQRDSRNAISASFSACDSAS